MAFGWLQLTGNLGSLIGGLFSVMIAPITFIGIPGWRISFHIVGLISIVVGTLVYLFANDPHFPNDVENASNQVPNKTFWSEVKDLVEEGKSVSKIQSFQIIVAQGVTGSFPWSALSFAPMWLELTGFSHEKTAFLIALFVIASSVGGLLGGKMGDILSTRLPNSGRIILAQISSASAIPLAAILLLGLPADPSTAVLHGLVLIIMGLFISWNAPAANKTYPRDKERARMEVLIELEMQRIGSNGAATIEPEELFIEDYDGDGDGDGVDRDEDEENILLYRLGK
ncbi:hypothetical protein PIB30_048980 [Stylosanthes scabra]|nr:hypothetical protein [Stylosanthes scabra]